MRIFSILSFLVGLMFPLVGGAQTITITDSDKGYVICPGGQTSIKFTTTGTFQAGNIFTVQVSDAAGSFAVPKDLLPTLPLAGTDVGAEIIFNAPQDNDGAGYRIRITGSNPTVVSGNFVSLHLKSLILKVTKTDSMNSCILPDGGFIVNFDINSFPPTDPVRYRIDGKPSQQSNVFTGLTGGTYNVYVVDGRGCQATNFVTVPSRLTLPVIYDPAKKDPDCKLDNGEIYMEATGTNGVLFAIRRANTGRPAINEYQSGKQDSVTGVTRKTFTGLPIGSYTIYVRDFFGCIDSARVNLQNAVNAYFEQSGIQQVTCRHGSDGALSFEAFGAGHFTVYRITANDRIKLAEGNGVQITVVDDNLKAGVVYNYVMVDDVTGCELKQSHQLDTPGIDVSYNIQRPGCVDGSLGFIDVLVTRSDAPKVGIYHYRFNNRDTTATLFKDLQPGVYRIEVWDEEWPDCIFDELVPLDAAGDIAVDEIRKFLPCTNNDCNGRIEVHARSSHTLRYSIDGPSATENGTGVFTGLCAQNYTISVWYEDQPDCKLVKQEGLPVAPDFTAEVQVLKKPCADASGIVKVEILVGSRDYEYAVNGVGFAPANIIGGLRAGNYVMHVRDKNGCVKQYPFEIQNSASINVDVTLTDPTCNGNGFDGMIFIKAYGDLPLDLFPQIGNNAIANSGGDTLRYTITGLGPGDKIYRIRDINGCEIAIGPYSLVVSEKVVLEKIEVKDANCLQDNGAIIIHAKGGGGQLEYKLNDLPYQDANLYANLPVGRYFIKVRSKVNPSCILYDTVEIGMRYVEMRLDPVWLRNACFGLKNGEIWFNVIGGLGQKVFRLVPRARPDQVIVQDSGRFKNLAPGVYDIFVMDEVPCEESYLEITLTETPEIKMTSATPTHPSCAPGNDGCLDITGAGGEGALQYSLDGVNYKLSGRFCNLTAQNYTIRIKDARGCELLETYLLEPPKPPVIDSIRLVKPTCFGKNDGEIMVFAHSGNGNLSYKVGNGAQDNGRFRNLAAGRYSISVLDQKACAATKDTILNDPPEIIPNVTHKNAGCGNADGSIHVEATGGSGPLEAVLDPGNIVKATPADFANLATNEYTVTIRETGNTACFKTVSVKIEAVGFIKILNAQVENLTCFGQATGQVSIFAFGGTQPLKYQLGGRTISSDKGAVFDSLSAGRYPIRVFDDNGCEAFDSIQVDAHPQLFLDSISTKSPSCPGKLDGAATIHARGGSGVWTYSMDSLFFRAPNTYPNLESEKPYKAYVKDGNSCIVSKAFMLTSPVKIDLEVTKLVPLTCFGALDGAIEATGAGGSGTLTYTLTPPNLSNQTGVFAGLAGNIYTLKVTDANGCSKTIDNLELKEPAKIKFTSLVVADAGCGLDNGRVEATAEGGSGTLQFLLKAGGGSVSGPQSAGVFADLPDDNYILTVFEPAYPDCKADSAFAIKKAPGIQLVSLEIVKRPCPGDSTGALRVQASGGSVKYTLGVERNTSGEFIGRKAGKDTVLVKDAVGCTLKIPFEITALPAIVLDSLQLVTPTCEGQADGHIVVIATGGSGVLQYARDGGGFSGNKDFDKLTGAKRYTLRVRDTVGCELAVDTLLNDAQTFSFTLTKTDITCFGLTNGKIRVEVIDGASPFEFYLNDKLIDTAPTPYEFIGLSPDTPYLVRVKDAKGCEREYDGASLVLTQPALLQILAVKGRDINCHDDPTGYIEMTLTGGVGPYEWTLNGLNPAIDPDTMFAYAYLPAGRYFVQVKDSNGCAASWSDTLVLAQPDSLILTASIGKQPNCFDDADGELDFTVQGGTGPYTLFIDTVAFPLDNADYQRTGLKSGAYRVYILDANGCKTPDTTLNLTSLTPEVKAGDDFAICIVDKSGFRRGVAMTGRGLPAGGVWSGSGVSGGVFSYDDTTPAGAYSLTYEVNGCRDELVITVVRVDAGPADTLCLDLAEYAPTNFSPPGGKWRAPDGQFNVDPNTGRFALKGVSPGNYALEYIVSGCTSRREVTLAPLPDANFVTNPPDGPFSVEEPILFVNQSTAGPFSGELRHEWRFGAASSTELSPTYTFVQSGMFNVSLKVVDGLGCSDTAAATLEVLDLLVAALPNVFTPNGDGTNDWFPPRDHFKGRLSVKMAVFNANGQLMWRYSTDTPGWDGSHHGASAPVGVYFFALELKDPQKPERPSVVRKGSVTLLR